MAKGKGYVPAYPNTWELPQRIRAIRPEFLAFGPFRNFSLLEASVARYTLQARSYFEEYAGLKKPLQALFTEVHKKNAKGFFKETDLALLVDSGFFTEDELRKELNTLVQKNFFYYNPTLAEYKLQGRSMEIGLEMYARVVEGYGR